MSSSNSNIFKKSALFHPEKLVQRDEARETQFKRVRLSNGTSAPYQSNPLFSPERQPAVKNRKKKNVPPENSPPQQAPDEQDLAAHDIVDSDQTDQTISAIVEPAPEPKAQQPQPPEQAPPVPAPDIEEIQQAAYTQGFEEGQRQALEEYQTSGKTLFNIAEQLNGIREVIIQNSIGEMQDLVITIAEKIIRHSVTAQDDTIVATVEEAIRKAVKSSEFYICLNTSDYTVIKEKSPELINKISGLEQIFIKIDDQIEPGGCIIESDNCTVDATIASQLQLIKDHLDSKR